MLIKWKKISVIIPESKIRCGKSQNLVQHRTQVSWFWSRNSSQNFGGLNQFKDKNGQLFRGLTKARGKRDCFLPPGPNSYMPQGKESSGT